MAAIVSPATGDTATAAWADSVADQINQMHAFMTFVPGATFTTPASGTATWVTMGNVTVPAWATRARVSLTVTGIKANVTTAAVLVAVKIGSSTGVGKLFATPTVTNPRIQGALNDLLTSVPTGSQSVTVQATFVSDTMSVLSTLSSFDLNIDWMQ
jgi:hypothetical protein